MCEREANECDVRTEEGRAALVARARSRTSEATLGTYARRATELALPYYWFLVDPLDHVSIRSGSNRSHGMSLEAAIAAVEALWQLRDRPGFDHLIDGWRNAPQVASAVSELRCILFLSSAKSHSAIEFGPLVTGDPDGSRADLLWRTTEGDFLVEVKSLRTLASAVATAANRMLGEAVQTLDGLVGGLAECRLDVVCRESGSHFSALLREAVAEFGDLEVSKAGAEAERSFVRVTLRRRASEPEAGGPCIRATAVTVGDKATKVHPVAGSAAWLTVSLLLGPKLRRAVRSILQEARRQLRGSPLPSIIYLEADHLAQAVAYLQEVMPQQEYAAIPLVIVSDGEQAHLVRRQVKEPEDNSLDATLTVLARPR